MANKNEVKLIVTADTAQADSSLKGFTAQMKAHWIEFSAAATAAYFSIRKIYTEFAAAAEREEKRMAFTNLAATFHTNADSIIADLKRMSGQSITTSRAIELAAKPMISGLNPRTFSGLMEFAKTMTNVIPGAKAADLFEDFTRAIITGQDRMLRMQGITVDFDKAQKDLAATLGGTKEQLNENQIQYANLTAMLKTASEMTQRLGKDTQSMADKLDITTTEIAESFEKVKNSMYQAFGTPALLILKAFGWEMDQLNYLINFGKAAYQRIQGLFSSDVGAGLKPAPTNELTGAHRGATSLKDLGFTFDEQLGPGLQRLKDYTEELRSSLGEISKSEKDLTKEATNQIKDREAAYKNMYEALKFDTEKYYSYQKGLLEKQRDEEIAITGDLTLAWEAYYARLQKLEEERILRTDDFLGGIKAYYAQLDREGITWAEGAKNIMEEVQAGMSNSIKGFLDSSYKDSKNFLDNLGGSIVDFLDNIVDAMFSMYAQMSAKGIMSFFGNFFNFGARGETGAMAIFGHDGGYVASKGIISRYHSGGEVPAILQTGEGVISRRGMKALDRINQGNIGNPNINVAINVENQTNRQVEMRQKSSRFDGEKYVVNVILKDLNSNGALRTAFAGIK